MSKELITIEKQPKIPVKWNYSDSVSKVKLTVYKWKNLTIELANELYIAREILANPGARTDLEKKQTWTKYCEEIGSEIHTVNGWLRKYFQPLKKITEVETPLIPKGKFNVIYADPPWKYDVDLSKSATRSPENSYPVMDLEDLIIFGEKVKQISNNDCILFLWITAPKLNWMNNVLEAWDFEYKTNFIWDKVKHNMGHYSSVRHEILVIAGKGNCAPTCDGKTIQSIDSVQSIQKSKIHSEKPEEFIKIIEKLYPSHKKIELFARNNIKRKGWSYWGNESNG